MNEKPCLSLLCSAMLMMGVGISTSTARAADSTALESEVRTRAAAVESQLIGWRRDIHQHPELGDQEVRTAKLVADHLRSLGIEVQTGVARHGVVGILRGAQPGPVVALRADMDALPVKEPAGLPFASTAKGNYQGNEVSVMHACGHDAHTAMLMASASVLAGMRSQLPGTVMFIFQPAEEGPSLFMPGPGKTWGARMMLEEGLFKRLKPAAVFGLHVMPGRSGEITWRVGSTTASSDTLNITVKGKQGHGGTGPNIVPESVEMSGTIRTYDKLVRKQVGEDIRLSAEKIAESSGAHADVSIVPMYDETVNDEALAQQMAPVLKRATDGKVGTAALPGAAEDFSFYAKQAPALFVFLGITPEGQDPAKAAPNHNPQFFVDEKALVVGTRAMASMAVNFLSRQR